MVHVQLAAYSSVHGRAALLTGSWRPLTHSWPEVKAPLHCLEMQVNPQEQRLHATDTYFSTLPVRGCSYWSNYEHTVASQNELECPWLHCVTAWKLACTVVCYASFSVSDHLFLNFCCLFISAINEYNTHRSAVSHCPWLSKEMSTMLWRAHSAHPLLRLWAACCKG